VSYTAVVSGPVFESVECMTQEQFAAWVAESPDREGGCELLNGRIVMTPPARYPHGRLEARLMIALGGHVRAQAAGEVLGSSQGFALPSGDTVEPDLAFVERARWALGPAPTDGELVRVVPDLVVEILSPSTASRDRGEKKAIYERNGVRELWLVDPRARRVTRFALADLRYDLGTVFEQDETLDSTVLAGFSLALAELFGD